MQVEGEGKGEGEEEGRGDDACIQSLTPTPSCEVP